MELTKPADTSNGNSAIGALIVMFYEPTKAFGMLEPRRHAWLPLVLVMLSTAAMYMWYYSVVDIAWVADQMNSAIKNTADRERANAMMTKGVMQGVTLGFTFIVMTVVTALIGVYFMLVAKFMGKEFTFGTGFALAAWSSVIGLLLLPLAAIQIMLSSDPHISQSELNPLSLNQLIFQYDMSNAFAGPLDMLSVTTIWGMALMVIGFQAWAKVSRAAALKVVLIPYVTVFGIWFAIAMAMSKAA